MRLLLSDKNDIVRYSTADSIGHLCAIQSIKAAWLDPLLDDTDGLVRIERVLSFLHYANLPEPITASQHFFRMQIYIEVLTLVLRIGILLAAFLIFWNCGPWIERTLLPPRLSTESGTDPCVNQSRCKLVPAQTSPGADQSRFKPVQVQTSHPSGTDPSSTSLPPTPAPISCATQMVARNGRTPCSASPPS